MKLRIAALAAITTTAVAASGAFAETTSTTLKTTVALKDGVYSGPITGKPFGKGKVTFRATGADAGKVTVKFKATYRKGVIDGVAKVTLKVEGETQIIDGTLDLTKGTKSFKGVKAKRMKVTGRGPAAALKISAKGKVTLPDS